MERAEAAWRRIAKTSEKPRPVSCQSNVLQKDLLAACSRPCIDAAKTPTTWRRATSDSPQSNEKLTSKKIQTQNLLDGSSSLLLIFEADATSDLNATIILSGPCAVTARNDPISVGTISMQFSTLYSKSASIAICLERLDDIDQHPTSH